jgi:hypothetical protein
MRVSGWPVGGVEGIELITLQVCAAAIWHNSKNIMQAKQPFKKFGKGNCSFVFNWYDKSIEFLL